MRVFAEPDAGSLQDEDKLIKEIARAHLTGRLADKPGTRCVQTIGVQNARGALRLRIVALNEEETDEICRLLISFDYVYTLEGDDKLQQHHCDQVFTAPR